MIQIHRVEVWKEDRKILSISKWETFPNENWIVLGRNGAGKSTLLNVLYGFVWPTVGEVSVLGMKYGEIPIIEIRSKIGILEPTHQESRLQRYLTVKEILYTGILGTIGLYQNISKEQEDIVEKTIEKQKWIHDPLQKFDTLSSGEKKKILLARAMLLEPKILLLDEPTSSLDLTAREEFYSILENYNKDHQFQSILITHRTEEIPHFYTNALLLDSGNILAKGKMKDVLNDENLSSLYGIPVKVHETSGRYFCVPKDKV
jgi:iron complex transport system ATP-binding protein